MTDFAAALAQLNAHRHAEALPLFTALIAAGSHGAGPYRGRARCLTALGQTEAAIETLRAALPLAPEDPFLLNDLIETLLAAHDWDAAEPHIEALRRLAPENPGPYRRLAALHGRRNRPDLAVAAFEAAIAHGDRFGATRNDLGNALLGLGRPMAAIARFQEAATLVAPEQRAAVALNLANAYGLAGREPEARATIEAVLDAPDAPLAAHHVRLLGLHYRPDLTQQTLLDAHRAYGARATAEAGNPPRPRPAPGDGRLRIGYVSGDFYTHSVAYFLEAVLAQHDRARFAITCYATQTHGDATTDRIAASVERFIRVDALDSDSLAARIRADGIDILVDLSGHTAGNRLAVFARRPAPVQVAWLGYPCTTGLPAMDWIIADRIALPPEEEALCAERVIRLPGCYLCFVPPEPAPPRRPTPMLDGQPPRFAAIANLAKLNDPLLAAWAQILNALPGATLTLRTRVLEEPATADLLRARFAAQGGDPACLTLEHRVSRPDHLARLGGYDLLLDPFPYPGVTMTAEALWAGVPVLALRGRFGLLARSGASLLTTAGIPEAIAETPEAYIAQVIAWGRDPAALQALRARIDTTRLTDAPRFTRELEAVFLAIRPQAAPDSAPGVAPPQPPAAASPTPLPPAPPRADAEARPPAAPAPSPAPSQRMAQAIAHLVAKRFAEALPLFTALTEAGLEGAGPHRGRGRCLRELGRLAEAEAAFRAALALSPEDVHAQRDLAELLLESGQLQAAIPAFEALVPMMPASSYPHRRLALIHLRLNRPWLAVPALEAAIARGDQRPGTLSDLGNALAGDGRPSAALARFEQALALPESGWIPRANYANALNLAGLPEQAHAQSALVQTEPDVPPAVRHIHLLGLHYLPSLTRETYAAEHRAYGAEVTAAAGDPPRPPRRDRAQGDRRLRIGYLSADLRAHPVGYFIEGVLAAHDRDAIVPFAYANQHIADDTTRRIASHLEALTPITRLDDAALAARLRADELDILIDLSGHTAGTRLPVFAHRPAPILATWLGYAGPSGLPAMDWIIADAIGLPPEDEPLYTERPLRLPGCYLCFRPPDLAPPRGPAPMLAGQPARFGCFANLAKLNTDVLRAWARILAALPGATLDLRTRALAEPATVDALAARFAAAGGDPARLRCAPMLARDAYLASYGDIDLMLDPFPFPGGTTTAEALWAGTPVLALRGRFGLMSRNGETLLTAAGIPEAISADPEAYVAKAIAFGRDAQAMQALRARIDTTRLTDAAAFARNLEEGFRRMMAETPSAARAR